MARGLRPGMGLVLAAVASAVYWLAVLAILERATSFDYTTGAAPDEGMMMVKAGVVIIAGPLLYAAILFSLNHLRGVRAAAATIGFGVFAGVYWTFVAFFLLSATAGDARDGATRDVAMQRAVLIATVLLAPIIFAMTMKVWRELTRGRIREQ